MRYEPVTPVIEPISIDLKDKKILSCLDSNARMSYSQIAKKVGLSKESVRYRILQLEKLGVIQDYKVIVDIRKIHYRAYHLFITFNNPEIEVEKECLRRLMEFSFVRAILKFNGDYDFEIALVAKGIDELDENLKRIFSGINKFIKKQELLIIVKSYVSRSLPLSFIEPLKFNYLKGNVQFNIDDVDLKVVKFIKDQACLPINDIAKKLKISSDIVSYRLNKLESSGFIIKYVPGINYFALGFQVYAILLNVDALYENTEVKLYNFLKEDKNIIWGVKTIGRYNVLIYVCTKNSEELNETINSLRTIFSESLKDYKTLIAYKEFKYTGLQDEVII